MKELGFQGDPWLIIDSETQSLIDSKIIGLTVSFVIASLSKVVAEKGKSIKAEIFTHMNPLKENEYTLVTITICNQFSIRKVCVL